MSCCETCDALRLHHAKTSYKPPNFPSFFCIWGFPKQHPRGKKSCLSWTPNKSGGEINPIQLSECGSREVRGNNNQVPFGFHGYNLKKNRDSVCHGVRGRAPLHPPDSPVAHPDYSSLAADELTGSNRGFPGEPGFSKRHQKLSELRPPAFLLSHRAVLNQNLLLLRQEAAVWSVYSVTRTCSRFLKDKG